MKVSDTKAFEHEDYGCVYELNRYENRVLLFLPQWKTMFVVAKMIGEKEWNNSQWFTELRDAMTEFDRQYHSANESETLTLDEIRLLNNGKVCFAYEIKSKDV